MTILRERCCVGSPGPSPWGEGGTQGRMRGRPARHHVGAHSVRPCLSPGEALCAWGATNRRALLHCPISPSVICFANATSLVRGRLFSWPPLTRGLSSAARLGERLPLFPRGPRPPGRPRAPEGRPCKTGIAACWMWVNMRLAELLMCHKVAHRNWIDSGPQDSEKISFKMLKPLDILPFCGIIKM